MVAVAIASHHPVRDLRVGQNRVGTTQDLGAAGVQRNRLRWRQARTLRCPRNVPCRLVEHGPGPSG